MDMDTMKMDFDSVMKQKDIELSNVRKILNEERLQSQITPVIEDRGSEEVIRKLKRDLEDSYVTSRLQELIE